MFLESFQVTISGIAQIVILGAAGFVLFKRNILGVDGLNAISRLVVEVTLPLLIFSQLIKDFSFAIYPNWWIFPLISIGITIAGLLAGGIFSGSIIGWQKRVQFLSLTAFQNSAYLPLVLISSVIPQDSVDTMFVYLFLFLLGFNLVIWSFGVYMLTFTRTKRFEMGTLFSPPVIATLASLILIYFGITKFIPPVVLKPIKMIGECTVPLAMFVVGGNLAAIKLEHMDKKAVFITVVVKLILLPLLGLGLLRLINLPVLVGALIVMQMSMPPATSLSVIIRHYKKEDLLISQGIFFGHIVSLITIPLFLSLYFSLNMIK